jgi:hypothetical protein
MILEWSPEEAAKADNWNSIADQIESDLIHRRETYERVYGSHCIKKEGGGFDHDWKPKDDFERGVAAALGLIRHRVHCMNPG